LRTTPLLLRLRRLLRLPDGEDSKGLLRPPRPVPLARPPKVKSNGESDSQQAGDQKISDEKGGATDVASSKDGIHLGS